MTAEQRSGAGGGGTLSAAARRERQQELAARLGERAAVESDRLMIEAGGGVALSITVEPSGAFLLTWWQTISQPAGHPRWAEVAAGLTRDGETIYGSAVGGGGLAELQRRAATVEEAVRMADDRAPVERVQSLLTAFTAGLAQLPPEPIPDALRLEERPQEEGSPEPEDDIEGLAEEE